MTTIDRTMEQRLRMELAAAIEDALKKFTDNAQLPYIGPSTTALMADAAVTILLALDDTQAMLERDGLMSEE